jgi:hypothetical protein
MVKRIKVTQKKPVSWLDPKGLLRTGIMAFESALFGSYADRREVIAALSPSELATAPGDKPKPSISYADKPEIWFDYIADTGDGWNATYAIACLAGDEDLRVLPPLKVPTLEIPNLPRAHFTVLGGDEVYPTASLENYKTRLTDPFWCANSTGQKEQLQKVYALPGNHDWYDGLTSFMRLFLQGDRQLGPWMTEQRRTYFAIELPHNWWIWGVDVQLESDVDAPQIDYFQHYAREFLHDGDRVILCTPEPSWVEGGADEFREAGESISQTHKNLERIEKMIAAKGAGIPLRIAGDLHHYARYQGEDGKSHLVTCGGGGAFLHSTHPMPPKVAMNKSPTYGQIFGLQCLYPSIDWCKKQRKYVFSLLFKNPHFALAVGLIYAFYAWALESASLALTSLTKSPSLMHTLAVQPNCPLGAWWDVVQFTPLGGLLTILLLWGPAKYGHTMKRLGNASLPAALGGLIHGVIHLSLAVGLMWLAARVPVLVGNIWATIVLIAILGGIAGSFVMAAYLYFANLFYSGHDEEVFSCQAIIDYKGFARFHLAADGTLTLYPIGLERVPRRWKVAPGAKITSTRGHSEPVFRLETDDNLKRIFEPDPPGALQPRLIEPPIKIG